MNTFIFFYRYLGIKIYLLSLLGILAAFFEGLGLFVMIPVLMGDSDSVDLGIFQELVGSVMLFLNSLGIEGDINTALVFAVIFIIAKGLILFFIYLYGALLRVEFSRLVKQHIFEAFLASSVHYFFKCDSGKFFNILNHQSSQCVSALNAFSQLLALFGLFICYIVFAIIAAPQFGVFAFLSGPILVAVFFKLHRVVRRVSMVQAQQQGLLSTHVAQALSGFVYLKATGQFRVTNQRFLSALEALAKSQMFLGISAAITQSLREPLAAILVVVIILFVMDDSEIGTVFASLALFYRALMTAVTFQEWMQKFNAESGSVRVVEEALREFREHNEQVVESVLSSQWECVVFDSVSFRYPTRNDFALKDLNLTIKRNSFTAIVGGSGGGKSTLGLMLAGVIGPDSGSLRVSPVNTDIFGDRIWRSRFGYVPQEPVIFNGSIYLNLTLSGTASSEIEEKCWAALDDIGLSAFVRDLPKGLMTELGERGVQLSGGQKQRIALAREIIRGCNILLLDEATSALDSETEELINNVLAKIRHGVTLVVIAHRLSTVVDADQIVVIESGKLVERGSFQDLMSKASSRLGELARRQVLKA